MKSAGLVDPRPGHRPRLIALIYINLIVYIAVLTNDGYFDLRGTLTDDPQTNVLQKYYNEITPASPTFAIWGVIYIWNLVWIVYTITLIFRKSAHGAPAYLDPCFLPPLHYVWFILSSVLNFILGYFVRSDLPGAAILLLFFMAIFQYFSLYVGYRALDRASPELCRQGRVKDVWLTRGLVFNGLGVYAAWLSATFVNFFYPPLIRSGGQIDAKRDPGTIALTLVFFLVVIFTLMDLGFLDRYTRYTLTPYFILVIAFSGAVVQYYREGEKYSVYLAVLLTKAVTLVVLKLALTVYRHRTRPHFNTGVESACEQKCQATVHV